jgi:ElaB/YqjD/DUF883 family membrane-anchored ribosome-binding protein
MIEDVVEDEKTALNQKLTQLNATVESILEVNSALGASETGLLSSRDEIVVKINQDFNAVRSALDAKEKDILGQVEAYVEERLQGLGVHVVAASASLAESNVMQRETAQQLAMADGLRFIGGVNEANIQIDQCLAKANKVLADVFVPPGDIKYAMDNNVLASIADISIRFQDIKALPIDTGNGNDGDLVVR